MKKLYDAPKALNLDNILSEEVFSDDVIPETQHVCNCAIDGDVSEPCDGNCSCFNKTFENLRK